MPIEIDSLELCLPFQSLGYLATCHCAPTCCSHTIKPLQFEWRNQLPCHHQFYFNPLHTIYQAKNIVFYNNFKFYLLFIIKCEKFVKFLWNLCEKFSIKLRDKKNGNFKPLFLSPKLTILPHNLPQKATIFKTTKQSSSKP